LLAKDFRAENHSILTLDILDVLLKVSCLGHLEQNPISVGLHQALAALAAAQGPGLSLAIDWGNRWRSLA